MINIGSTFGAGRETGFDFYKRTKTKTNDMKQILTSFLMIIMAATAISCNNKVDLNGDWRITSVGSEKIESSEAGPSLSFNAETGRIHGYTGVNIVNGEYEHEGRTLTLKGLGTTMMAGPDEDMRLERKIVEGFEKIKTAKESPEGEVILYDSDGNPVMSIIRK